MGTWVPTTWKPQKQVNVSSPWITVNERFDLSTQYAESSFAITTDFISQLETLLGNLVLPESTIDDVVVPDVTPLSYDARPGLGDLTLPAIPDNEVPLPVWEDLPTFDPVEFPEFNVVAPAYDIPEKPDHTVITDPGEPGEIAIIEYPAKPDMDIPVAPVLADITFPATPVITLPEFEGEVPTDTWDLPANFNYNEAAYNSDIWAELLSKVLDDIRNGGTGLGALIEDELYDRAKAKNEAENERLYEEILDYFEARGFSLPQGAQAGRLAEAGREIVRNNAEIISKIMISQSELAQKNTHFMVDKGVQLEGIMRDFFNQQANRAFEAAKAVVQVGVELYNAQVNQFNARVSAYQAQGAVFESRVKAALSQAQIYKTQIDACSVMSDVQKTLVDIYSAKIGALDTFIKLYATEMEAARIKSDVEKNKLELFNLQVQIYIARVEADKAKFDVYVRELEGERTKAMVYSEQVRAYATEIDAKKAESDVNLQQVEIALKQNTLISDKYRAELTAYEIAVKAVKETIAAEVEGFKAEAMAYSAETEAEGSWFRAKVEEMRVGVENARTKLQKAIAEIDASVKGFTAVKGLQVEGTTGIMNTAAQLCASSMNAVNASASLGFSGSEGNSESWSHGESISESHPYEEQAS